MLTEKKEQNRAQVEITSPDLMVPGDHLLRKIDAAVDFDHIYTLVRDLYCADKGDDFYAKDRSLLKGMNSTRKSVIILYVTTASFLFLLDYFG